ncbi:MAG: Rpn family recombination-promoting nuclease/putative transposase [Defluviitaleaceae bacterium]|nr:Rpn family recombination-promoting nuclease/putative transposase [Defluviitaleaceae bacterium]
MTIDFDKLMDLRVDYAFKLFFVKSDPCLLIWVLNAVFANKGIPRVVKSLEINNPTLEKETKGGKLVILDVKATLDSGIIVLIEMHLYKLSELKAKTIYSWARSYGDQLKGGEKYLSATPIISITFAEGQISPLKNNRKTKKVDKIHRLCMITDIETGEPFTSAMEMHYIDTKAFLRAIKKKTGGKKMKADKILLDDNKALLDNVHPDLTKWLSLITQSNMPNKNLIKNLYETDEQLKFAVDTLALYYEDTEYRNAYDDRLREMNSIKETEEQLVQKDKQLVQKDKQLVQKDKQLVQKDKQLAQEQQKREQAEQLAAEKDRQIALLLQKVAEQGITL